MAKYQCGQTVIYVLTFCASGLTAGVYQYLVLLQKHHGDPVSFKHKVVIGISAAAAAYSLFGIFLTGCLSHKPAFAALAVLLNLVLFCGLFASLLMTSRKLTIRDCGIPDFNVRTPLGDDHGAHYSKPRGRIHGEYSLTYHCACTLNMVAFSGSCVAAGLFLGAAVGQLLIMRRRNNKTQHPRTSAIYGNRRTRNLSLDRPSSVYGTASYSGYYAGDN